MTVKMVRYYTKVRADLLNKAVEEYLEKHPEEVKVIKKTENKDSDEIHGPEWDGWREIPVGKHNPGDWVVGTICNWRGTTSADEDRVPACSKEIPPYKYTGGKYEQYCCNLHSLYTQVAYTLEEIKYRVRVISGNKDWRSPLDVNHLAIMIEGLEKNESLTEIGRKILDYRVVNSLVLFNNPIMQAKYPKVYTQELIERIKEYRKMPSRIAKMVQSDMLHRGIDSGKSCYIYGLSMQELKDAIDIVHGESNGNEKNKV